MVASSSHLKIGRDKQGVVALEQSPHRSLFGIDNYAAVVRKTLLESGRQIIQNGHVRKISLVSRDKNNHISLPDMVAAREWIVPIDKRLEREEATAILFGCDHSL